MKRILGLALVLSLGACLNTDDNVEPPVIPPGSLVFTFEPTALSYAFIDSTVNPALRLDWLVPPANQYVGAQLGLRSIHVEYFEDLDAGDLRFRGWYFGGVFRY